MPPNQTAAFRLRGRFRKAFLPPCNASNSNIQLKVNKQRRNACVYTHLINKSKMTCKRNNYSKINGTADHRSLTKCLYVRCYTSTSPHKNRQFKRTEETSTCTAFWCVWERFGSLHSIIGSAMFLGTKWSCTHRESERLTRCIFVCIFSNQTAKYKSNKLAKSQIAFIDAKMHLKDPFGEFVTID